MFENIEGCLGLHEELEVVFLVDRYKARTMLQDGNVFGPSAEDPTVAEAMASLDLKLTGQDYRSVRKAAF